MPVVDVNNLHLFINDKLRPSHIQFLWNFLNVITFRWRRGFAIFLKSIYSEKMYQNQLN